jgi:hypothetical protein
MTAAARRPAHDRWRDVDGTPVPLFCSIEQVKESPEPAVLPSRLHQQGHVVGESLDSLYVCFRDNQVVGLPPHLVRLLPDIPDER